MKLSETTTTTTSKTVKKLTPLGFIVLVLIAMFLCGILGKKEDSSTPVKPRAGISEKLPNAKAVNTGGNAFGETAGLSGTGMNQGLSERI